MKDSFERRRHVPMHFRGRISTDRYDPGFANHEALMSGGYKITILFNGREQSDVVTADPEEGWITRSLAQTGALWGGGVVQTDKIKGDVTIRLERVLKAGENAA